MIDFQNVKSIVIPEGEVSVIARGAEILWRKQKYKRELLYLEGTGKQYIDTGLDYFADFEVGIQLRANVSNKALGNGQLYCLQRHNASTGCWQFTSGATGYNTKAKITDYHVMMWKDNMVYVDGVKLSDVAKTSNKGNRMLLFSSQTNSAYPNIIYFCKLWSNNTLVRDFVPVLDMDDVPCLYDRVSGALFYNQGTGEFLYG